ncbi:type IV toxin-antitoxin system YeeU family antitoxin [Citrobacter sp. S2-9]|uniref:Type IV toxin-antitoxin system YeeU family antitoxin n=1 Tax=Citrobacter enshiensis TaxID=2971264 RepID=A0ABT8PX84_9ENTR|nr:type IV toxin-antitoxin system YeeU family antitoxin [Citrobacter enshiensis]MDN8600291.1 type IV toxin-antitoxin system YeeU family antitoxin [Citrobacter enshiensis]
MTQINSPAWTWGLRNDITPSFGARLVQEGNKLYFLADRASISGAFTLEQRRILDKTFPRFIKQMESALKKGQLDKRENRLFRCTLNGWNCEANTFGTHGYLFVTIYPVSVSESNAEE